jgi:hypothetical protein
MVDLEEEKLIRQVKTFFQSNQNSRFQEIIKGAKADDKDTFKDEKIYNQAGFKMRTKDSWSFYVPSAIHSKEVIKGFNLKTANKILIEKGFLQTLENGKPYKKKYSPFNKNFKDHYYYTSKVLDFYEDATPDEASLDEYF